MDERPGFVIKDPVGVLAAGSEILRPLLQEHGFALREMEHGKASGGYFARARWAREGRYLDTHVRHGLGIVVYGWDDDEFTHQDYLRSVGVRGAYPGYDHADPLDNFRRLVNDLEGPAAPLLVMSRVEFAYAAEGIGRLPKQVLP